MTARAVTYIDGIQVAGQDLRLLTAALLQPDSALSAISGVRPGAGDLKVTANGTPNMSVNVAAGQAFIDGTESFAQGVFLASNDATVNLTIAAADATNPRRDLIVARIYSETVILASRRFALEVVTGTAAPSPVDPATPANSVVLARVAVAAAASSITSGVITDLRPFAVALGGIAPVSAVPASPYVGMKVFDTTAGLEKTWDGTGWLMEQAATFNGVFSTAPAVTGTLNYPVAFSAAPVISAAVAVGGNLDIIHNWVTVGATTASWRLFNRALSNVSGTATVHWRARGYA